MSTVLPSALPRLAQAVRHDIELSKPFIEVARRFAERPGTVALLSGGTHDSARFHLLALEPFVTLRAKGRTAVLAWGEHQRELQGDPFEILKQLMLHLGQHLPEHDNASFDGLPLRAGLFGYFGYDLKNHLERLPAEAHDDLHLPDLHLIAPRLLLIHERPTSRTTLLSFVLEGESPEVSQQAVETFWAAARAPCAPARGWSSPGVLRSGFDRERFTSAVGRILEYIAAGDVYQVNLSQRFEAPFEGDAFAFFEGLFSSNPAPFFAYVNAADHHIVSTSPERFLAVSGGHIETRPIKGTRPRGADPRLDAQLRDELQASVKEDAELSMIVDLLRNDLGKVCVPGSVRVTAHKQVESYENVTHLVSHITGTLEPGNDAVDVLRATFPGGSITGCPKIRAMEIIDELEPVRRHVYTGAIGYIGLNGSVDLSIAIRTATISQRRIVFSVGAGIVFDSDPASEYEETLHKGQTLIQLLNGHSFAQMAGENEL